MNTASLNRISKLLVIPAGLMLHLLTGCTVGPNYVRPQVPAPPAYRGADNSAVSSANQTSLGDENFAKVFNEPELQELIRTALVNNYNVRIAAQHVLEAQAQLRITRSQQFPKVSLGGTGIGGDLGSSTSSSLGSSIPNGPITFGNFNVSASWNPDFWGLYRRQTEAQRAQMLSQVWAQRVVRLSLVQQVATGYFQLRAYHEQLEIAKETLKDREESTALTRTLVDGGENPLSDLRQAQENEYTASAQIPQLQQQIQQQENALRLLLGENPGPVAATDPNALAPVPQNLPVGLPSRLLERRPDILEAEQQLIEANANIGVARAQFFPQVSLSASGGEGGSTWSQVFDPESGLIYGIGKLTQPVFEGGKLRGQLQLSKATKEEMVLNYRNTIITAFQQTSNALIAVNKQRAGREQQELLVAAAADALRLAKIQFQAGSTSYLPVLTTDATLFSAQLNLVTLQEGEALSLVQLYAALGGGWQ
jgi:multidrug efflux system outer membrane protein